MPRPGTVSACLLATLAVAGCASSSSSSSNRARDDPSLSRSTTAHGSLSDHDFTVAVDVARAEADKESAVLTSATATIGDGTVTNPNAGPPCTSGQLLHIKLIGTFPHIVTGGQPTDMPGANNDPVSDVLITADRISGKPCDISVETGTSAPGPGATLLFDK